MNTPTSSKPSGELLSALVDGELSPQELSSALRECAQDAEALGNWNSYQLIGEVLRTPVAAARSASPVFGADIAFMARLNLRLAQESALYASPVASGLPSTQPPGPTPVVETVAQGLPSIHTAAANDANFRWKLVAGLASLAAVSAIAWNAIGVLAPATAPQLAQGDAVQRVLVASPQGTMVRDARLEELLAAHKQMGGTSALQVPSGFLRNATFETPQNVGR
ncbi:MAG: RseA family anti-sigma factor [Pseudomonadota bacterium]